MKNMSKAKEFLPAPPIGTYKTRLTSVEAKASSSGNAMLSISGEIIEPEEYAGATFFDNILTDGEAKGAGFGKKKLRGLGQDVDGDVEKPDEVIAQELTGIETYIEFGHKARMSKNPSTGKYDVPVLDVQNGKQVPVMQLEVKNYLGAVNTAPATAPAAATEPAATQPAPAAAAQPAAPAAQAKAPAPWQKKPAAVAATK
jgi:hypothetical protein